MTSPAPLPRPEIPPPTRPDLYDLTHAEIAALVKLAAATAAEFERDPDDPDHSAYLRARETFTMPIPVHYLALNAAVRIAKRD